jgi:glycosyltransferase involved in cell wall biosynthesis
MSKKIKIGVNGWFFCKRYTGIGRYSLNVFPEMARLFPEFEFHIAIPHQMDEEVDKSLRYQENLKFELLPENPHLKMISPGLSKCCWEFGQLRNYFQREKVQLVHSPYPYLFRKIKGVPTIVTVHDTIPWTDKAYRNRGFLSGRYNKATLRKSLQADFLLTVSEQSKKEILELDGFNEKNLKVVYNASEFNETPEHSKTETAALLEKIGLKKEDRFLFYMGGFDRRKNVQRLLNIFLHKVAPESELKLVLGGANVLDNSLFAKLEWDEDYGRGRVISTGFLANSELIMLYRAAWAYCTLTTREGFNLPLLEALTLGCPALVSDLPVHHEVAEDIPVFLDLEQKDNQIAETILNLYNDPESYQQLKQRTGDFARTADRKYSWQKAAREIGEVYKTLIK